MLRVEHPDSYNEEREYIFSVVLGDFLGLPYHTVVGASPVVRITHNERPGSIEIADVLFQTPIGDWLTKDSMPVQPLQHMAPEEFRLADSKGSLPIIYGRRNPIGGYIEHLEGTTRVGVDIFGSAFFCLTRYEELVSDIRDRHDRFPSRASLAFQEAFLDRPIVNEYVEFLWCVLSRSFPALRRRQRSSRTRMTFDIDWPAITQGISVPALLHASGADIVRRREPALAVQRLTSWISVQRGNLDRDIGNNFDWIMDACESRDIQAVFYVITGGGRGDIDGSYDAGHPWFRRLLRDIHRRGHLIGLHPTYRTYRDADRTRFEFHRLRDICESEGIHQDSWGGRQHYLRWQAPTTWQNYEDSGLDHDSTLGFADNIGFRSGTCYEYPTYNLRSRTKLRLRERPLVAMDSALFGKPDKYGMDLSVDEAVGRLAHLAANCQRYHGDLTLLWHNNWLVRSTVRGAFDTVHSTLPSTATVGGVSQ